MKNIFSLLGLMYFTLICCLYACLSHTAFAFSTVNGGNLVEAYISAISIDLGLLVLSAAIMKWKKENRKTWGLWIGVFLFCSVSAYSNWLSAVAKIASIQANTNAVGEFMIGIRPFALSGILPILVIYMSEVLANYYQVTAKREENRTKRAINKEARKSAPTKAKKATASKDWSPKIPERELVR